MAREDASFYAGSLFFLVIKIVNDNILKTGEGGGICNFQIEIDWLTFWFSTFESPTQLAAQETRPSEETNQANHSENKFYNVSSPHIFVFLCVNKKTKYIWYQLNHHQHCQHHHQYHDQGLRRRRRRTTCGTIETCSPGTTTTTLSLVTIRGNLI